MTRSKPLGPSFASGSKHQREYGHGHASPDRSVETSNDQNQISQTQVHGTQGHRRRWHDRFRWGLLVADAWADDALKKRLLSDPAAVLKERGITTPAECPDQDDRGHGERDAPCAPDEAGRSRALGGRTVDRGGRLVRWLPWLPWLWLPWLPWLWRWLPWLWRWLWLRPRRRRPLVGLAQRRDRDPQLDLWSPVLSLGPGVTVAGDLSVVPALPAGPTDPTGGLNRNGGWGHDSPPVFNPHYLVKVIENEGVFLLSERHQTVLQGWLYEVIAPRLDGRPVEDLWRSCGGGSCPPKCTTPQPA